MSDELDDADVDGTDGPDGSSTDADGTQPVVDRQRTRRSQSDEKRRRQLIWGGAAGAVVIVALIIGIVLATKKSEKPVPTTTTTTTTTSTTTTTIPPALATATMPLTGLPVDGENPEIAAVLASPALAVKIDNDPAAQPYVGIGAADVIIELRVEGISRNIAVFHSNLPDVVGPVRSARTSDPDLLAMFVKPVFAWSGGNPTVTKVIRSTEWVVDANHNNAQADYFRTKDRKAPHNLMIRPVDLVEHERGEALPPQQLFEYVPHDEESTGVATSRISTSVGSSRADFEWDTELEKWVRMDSGGPRVDSDGEPVASTNVVVLSTSYTRSAADRKSPEAESLGQGLAWVFADGKVTAGTWTRSQRDQPWTLTADDGSAMRLMSGNTWILLPDSSAGTPVVG